MYACIRCIPPVSAATLDAHNLCRILSFTTQTKLFRFHSFLPGLMRASSLKPLPEAPPSELDLRESAVSAVSASASLTVSSRVAAQAATRRREAARAAELLPPADHLAQLRRWRAKASLLAQLAVRSELDPQPVPAFFPPRDFFGQALGLYQRAWHLCRCFDIGGVEHSTLAVELGFLLRVQGDAVGALEMAASAQHDELLGLCLRDLRQTLPSDADRLERVAKALETVRGSEEEGVLALLKQVGTTGLFCSVFSLFIRRRRRGAWRAVCRLRASWRGWPAWRAAPSGARRC
jgi:hypothetical protein